MSSAKFPAIVLDTNVFISAAILPNSTSAKALLVALETFEVNLSESTWIELLQVIGRPKLNRYIDDEGRHEFLQRIVRSSQFIETKSNITDCTDPKDNKFLELAVDACASIIVSGDMHLRSMSPFRGIIIYTPGEFLGR